jgi:hypothetical protein
VETPRSHARRKFFEAVKLNPRDQTSIRIVAQMDELFAIDEKARKENLNPGVALGRRNWIHIGSKEAGPRVAAIISVVETCGSFPSLAINRGTTGE